MGTLLLVGLLAIPLFHAPHDPIVAWAISPDYANDHTVWVGQNSFGCVLRSTDGGQTFHTINSGLDTAYINALAVSPTYASDKTVWCGEFNKLYRSTNGGDSWAVMPLEIKGADIVCIAVSPDYAQDRTIVVGPRRGGLLISRDDGATWQTTALPAQGALTGVTLGRHFAQDKALVATVGPNKVFLSRDGGGSFTELRAPPVPEIPAVLLADDFATSNTLWLGTVGSGVLVSTDAGQTWKRDGGGLDKGEVLHLAAVPDEKGVPVQFAATVKDGVWLRKAGGAWFKDGKGLREMSDQNPRHYFAVLPSPAYAQDKTVFVASFEGLQRSTDGGFRWQHLGVLPEQFVRNVNFSPRFAEDKTLWIATYGLGTLQSKDDGRSWARLNTGPWGFPDGMCVAPGYPEDPTFLVGSPRGLFLTHDDGANFSSALPQGKASFLHVAAFAPDYAQSGLVFMHNLEFGNEKLNDFMRSEDHGATWERTGPVTIHALAFAPEWEKRGRMYIATAKDISASDDRGRQWAPLPGLKENAWLGLACDTRPDGKEQLIAVSAVCGTYASSDGGQSWEPYAQGVEGVRAIAVALTPSFSEDGQAFLLTQNEGLYSRKVGEPEWTYVGLRGQYCMRVIVSPTWEQDHTLAVASYAGPCLSRDGGKSFAPLDVWGGQPGKAPPVKGKPGGGAPAGKAGGK